MNQNDTKDLRLVHDMKDSAARERAAEAIVMAEVESLAASLFAFRLIQIETTKKREAMFLALGIKPPPETRPIGRFMTTSDQTPLVRCLYMALATMHGPTPCFGLLTKSARLLVLSDESLEDRSFPSVEWPVLVDGEERLFDPIKDEEDPASTEHNARRRARTIPTPAWANYDLTTLQAAAATAREGSDRHEGRQS